MAESIIPVDLFNPGQVFACLGFMEAADILLGNAMGGFDWTSDPARPVFHLCADGDEPPVGAVLAFLADVKPERWAPIGYSDPPPKKSNKNKDEEEEDEEDDAESADPAEDETGIIRKPALTTQAHFKSRIGDKNTLPLRMGGGNRPVIELSHWSDKTRPEAFKLYSGNRSAVGIARDMLLGKRAKSKKNGAPGELKTKGLKQLWDENSKALIETPFDVLTPMGGSFNFDPRGAWTALDAGYSPNEHKGKNKHSIVASPVVEFLAAWGLEDARPLRRKDRAAYQVWSAGVDPMIARAVIGCTFVLPPCRRFGFDVGRSGKNSIVTFASLEKDHE